jgi:hypothetical protein
MDNRQKIIETVIDHWCSLLNIGTENFKTHIDSQTGHHFLWFIDYEVSNIIFKDRSHKEDCNMFAIDLEGVPLEYLESDLDDLLLKKSLYIYAWSKGERSIKDIMISGDELYITLAPFYQDYGFVHDLLEKWKKSKINGIYKIKKGSLLAHYMFLKDKE